MWNLWDADTPWITRWVSVGSNSRISGATSTASFTSGTGAWERWRQVARREVSWSPLLAYGTNKKNIQNRTKTFYMVKYVVIWCLAGPTFACQQRTGWELRTCISAFNIVYYIYIYDMFELFEYVTIHLNSFSSLDPGSPTIPMRGLWLIFSLG